MVGALQERSFNSVALIERQQQDDHCRRSVILPIGPPQPHNGYLEMAQHPTIKAVSFDDLATKYGVVGLHEWTVPSRFDTALIYNGQDHAESADRNNLKCESSVLNQTNSV